MLDLGSEAATAGNILSLDFFSCSKASDANIANIVNVVNLRKTRICSGIMCLNMTCQFTSRIQGTDYIAIQI